MKKSTILLTALLLYSLGLTSMAQSEPVDLDAIYKIKQEGFRNSQINELAFYMTDFVGPRLPNSTNGRKAQKWTSEKMQEWGLSNVHLEPWGEFGRGWDNEKTYVAMTAPYYAPMTSTPRAWTAGTNGLVKAEVVIVDIQEEADFEKYKGKLQGKIAIIPNTSEYEVSFEPYASRYTDEELEDLKNPAVSRGGRRRFSDADMARFRRMRQMRGQLSTFYKEEGLLAIMSGSGWFNVPRSSGASAAADAPETVPELNLAGEHHGRIIRLLQHEIPVEVELEIQNTFLEDDPTDYNVIGDIPGTDKTLKDELVMVGAHLDSWHGGTGAADNASGCIVMMEAMRILKAIGFSPRRTIRIALWGAEEQGLHGSRNYVREHFGGPGDVKPEHANLSAYYNVDNGTGKIRGIYLQENEMLRPVFESWFKPFNDMGVETITMRNTSGTDHLAFNAAGLNGFQFIQDEIEYGRGYHTSMDVYERLLMEDLMHNAVVVAALVYHTAMRDDLLPRKPMPEPTSGGGRPF